MPIHTNGNVIGTTALGRGALYAMLSNPIYIGRTRHKDVCYPGQHQAIIDQTLWDAVQERFKQNTVDRREHRSKTGIGFLTGKIFEEQGRRLSPSYAKKQGKQYRYYVSQHLITKGKAASQKTRDEIRIPAEALERVVTNEVLNLLADQHRLIGVLSEATIETNQFPRIMQAAQQLHQLLGEADKSANQLSTILNRVDVAHNHLRLSINLPSVIPRNDSNVQLANTIMAPDQKAFTIAWQVPMQFRRRGQELRLVIRNVPAPSDYTSRKNGYISSTAGHPGRKEFDRPAMPDQKLLKGIARARSWFAELKSGKMTSMEEIATREKITARYVARLLPLAFLAPDIVEAIAEGRQPVELTLASITKHVTLPMGWVQQRRILGIRP